MTNVSTIVWWEIESPDPEAFQRFCTALWDWRFEPAFVDTELGADYWIIQAGGQGIGGLQRAATPARPHPGARVYVAVADLEATLDRAVEHGGVIRRHRAALGGDDRWFAVVDDPSGVSFGLWTSHPASASP